MDRTNGNSARRREQERAFLQQRSFVELLVEAYDYRFNGTLVLSDPSGEKHGVWFIDGFPAGAHTNPHIAPLGAILRDLGVPDDATREVRIASGSPYDMLMAQQLMLRGTLTQEMVATAVRLQMQGRIGYMGSLPLTTKFSYHVDKCLLPPTHGHIRTPYGDADLLALLGACIRRRFPEDAFEKVLQQLGNAPLRIHRDAPLDKLDVDLDELAIMDAIVQRDMTYGDLLAANIADAEKVRFTVCLLAMSRSLRIPGEKRPPVAGYSTPRSGIVLKGQR